MPHASTPHSPVRHAPFTGKACNGAASCSPPPTSVGLLSRHANPEPPCPTKPCATEPPCES
eukprot:192265-Chlamydomonas_euryale.AAC.1